MSVARGFEPGRQSGAGFETVDRARGHHAGRRVVDRTGAALVGAAGGGRHLHLREQAGEIGVVGIDGRAGEGGHVRGFGPGQQPAVRIVSEVGAGAFGVGRGGRQERVAGVGEARGRRQAASRARTLNGNRFRFAARRIAAEHVGGHLVERGRDGAGGDGLCGPARVGVGVGDFVHGGGTVEGRVSPPTLRDVVRAGLVFESGRHSFERPRDEVHPGQVTRASRIIEELPGGAVGAGGVGQLVARPGEAPGPRQRPGFRHGHLGDRGELAAGIISERVAAAVREADGGELVRSVVGALDGMAGVGGEDGAEPLAVRSENVLAAVEALKLPAAGGGVEIKLAEFVGRRPALVEPQAAAGGEVGEFTEAAVPGQEPDVAGVGIDDDPLSIVVRPEAAEHGAPGGGAGQAVAADASSRVVKPGFAERGGLTARTAAADRHRAAGLASHGLAEGAGGAGRAAGAAAPFGAGIGKRHGATEGLREVDRRNVDDLVVDLIVFTGAAGTDADLDRKDQAFRLGTGEPPFQPRVEVVVIDAPTGGVEATDDVLRTARARAGIPLRPRRQ